MSQAKTQPSYNFKVIFKIIVTAATEAKSQRHIKLSRQHRLQHFLACVSARNGRSNAADRPLDKQKRVKEMSVSISDNAAGADLCTSSSVIMTDRDSE